jgi:hypothetical protein
VKQNLSGPRAWWFTAAGSIMLIEPRINSLVFDFGDRRTGVVFLEMGCPLNTSLFSLFVVKEVDENERNIKRFSSDFMFQLTEEEVKPMVSQNAIPSKQHLKQPANDGLQPGGPVR